VAPRDDEAARIGGERVQTTAGTAARAVVGVTLVAGVVVTGALLVVDGPAAVAPRIGLAAVGLLAVVVLAWAAVRGGPWLRLGWGAVALGAATQTLALIGSGSGWSQPVVWGLLRPVALVAFGVGLIASPGVWRGLREWGLLILDGWLLAASSFAITWCVLALTAPEPAGPHVRASVPLAFVAFEVVAASVCAGLTLRTAAGSRRAAILLLGGSVMAVSADATWAATADGAIPSALWLGVVVLFAAVCLFGRLDVFVTSVRPPAGPPRVARASQVTLVPGLLACLVAPGPDAVTMTVAVSLLAALAAQMYLSVRRYGRLWRELEDQADRLDALVSESGDAILQVDRQGRVEFANAAAAEVFGRAPQELTGRQAVGLIHPGDRGDAVRALMRLEGAGVDAVRVAARVRWADGWRHLEATVSRRRGGSGYTLSTRDVSERVRLEAELRRQATTDALTGLLSRSAFLATVGDRLRHGPTGVLFLDLDGFKSVNDTEGHAAGDQLLVRSARAVETALGPRDLAGRLGGDEFAVLAASDDPAEVRALAARLVAAIGSGIASPLGARVGASVGVALEGPTSDAGESGAAALVRDADLAMYEAKKRGGRTWVVFEPWMRERVLQRTRLHTALARAIEAGELRLEVQPIVALPQGECVGFEALVRWEDAGHLRGAGDFVPLAEETGLVVPLGTWVLRRALGWLASWPDPAAGIAVNVAGRQVAEPGFGDLVRAELAASGIDPARLTLEITERTAVDDLARAGAVLQPLRALGVHVALDDFGTGFSSLGYLAGLPVDELKIDRRFVTGLGVRTEDDALVRAVLALAADLGLRVVAEGVETPAQRNALVGLGCEMAQGLLYGAAVPIEQLDKQAVDLRELPVPRAPATLGGD
jgi:diguanylate cyclase (GGDEF)-like protein/PAS domain S-box-containing protein